MDTLRPFIARVLASVVAGIAAYITKKYGIELDAESQAAITGTMITIVFLVYSLAHRTIDKKVNPADAASTELSNEGKIENKQIRFDNSAMGHE